MKNSNAEHRSENRGIQILTKGDVKKQNDSHYQVRSQTDQNTWYDVNWDKNHWSCTCMDYQKNRSRCKHINAVNYQLILEEIKLGTAHLTDEGLCPECNRKDQVIKQGIRYNRSGPIQGYLCKRCNRKFPARPASFKGMKNKIRIITATIDLYFRGLSLRQITEHLQTTYNTKVCHGTIYYWLRKYVSLVSQYSGKLNANFPGRWHADETVLHVNGRHLLLWSLLDSDTRFIIATHISQKRSEEEAAILMKKGVNKSTTAPSEIVTDALPSYNNAIQNELGSANDQIVHLTGSLSKAFNNRMERLNGTYKNRMRTMAGFQNKEGAAQFVDGFSTFYNFIKPHMALGDLTPAQMLGLVDEKYSWLDLILAAENKKTKANTSKDDQPNRIL